MTTLQEFGLHDVYRRMPSGANTPTGWIAQQMKSDLCTGFVGHLDRLVPQLFADDVYGVHRRTALHSPPDVGAITGADHVHNTQFLWWNAETQSNWRNGWLRHAVLIGTEAQRAQAKAYVDQMLATQDPQGYLGIYAPDLRFHTTGENGELWAQATLLRTLLAYAEATQDSQVVEAVTRAVTYTRNEIKSTGWQPFDQNGGFAGVSHGLMWVDVLDQLAEMTGDKAWFELAVDLYRNYSTSNVSEADAQQANLLNASRLLRGHGAHTWEHLRAVAMAAMHSNAPELQDALRAFLEKAEVCLTPSGGPIGDEWIASRVADASETGYEYCSIVELFDTYLWLLKSSGALQWADRAEHLFLNAALGARHPSEPSIAYLKTDNSLSMAGVKHADRPEPDDATQTRYRYSPVHQEAAVCCVPNAGRLFPSYVQAQYLQTEDGIALALYGPSILRYTHHDHPVVLEQMTDFPDSLSLRLVVHVAPRAPFSIALRKPAWAKDVSVELPHLRLTWDAQRTSVQGSWSDGDAIDVQFDAQLQIKRSRLGEVYFQKGPLVFAQPIDAHTRTTRLWPQDVFREIEVSPVNPTDQWLELPHDFAARVIDTGNALQVPLVNSDGEEQACALVPMKDTVLRRVTFKVRAAPPEIA
jgi:DUF1680 family protein